MNLKKSIKKILQKSMFVILLIVIMMPIILFFYWMLVISMRADVVNAAYPPVLIPKALTLNNYKIVFNSNPFPKYLLNSLIVGTFATLLGLVIGLPAAYSIAKWKQKGIMIAVLLARMVPHISYLLPWFIIFRQLRLIDTYPGLILVHLEISLPIIIWMMISFFEEVPKELEDASLIDGCSIFSTFMRISIPIVKPGIAVVSILSFIFSWNNFMFSVVLSGSKTRTLPVAVYAIREFEEIVWGKISAAAVLVILPIVIITFFFQRYIVKGLTVGAVKI